jgi:nitroreductase
MGVSMELDEVIESRRSIRRFRPIAIPEDSIRMIINARRLAPSGSNLQPLRNIVAKTPAAIATVASCSTMPFVAQAPVVILCLIDMRFSDAITVPDDGITLQSRSIAEYNRKRKAWSKRERRTYLNLNAGIAIEHLALKAVDLGLECCWVRLFDGEKLHRLLDIDDRYEIAVLLPIGYPGVKPDFKPRLPLNELILKEI